MYLPPKYDGCSRSAALTMIPAFQLGLPLIARLEPNEFVQVQPSGHLVYSQSFLYALRWLAARVLRVCAFI
jgi:hypothetical protein